MIPRPRQLAMARPRLLDQLKGGADRVVLAAPSGFGKTTLLAQLGEELTSQGLKVAWVDATDLHHGRDLEVDVLLVDSIRPGDFAQVCRHVGKWCAAQEGIRVFAATDGLRSRAPQEWVLVGEHDLRFTEDETARLARALGAPADSDYVARLLEETGGWPLAVRTRILGEGEMEVARGLYQSIPPGPKRAMAGLLAHMDWVRPVLLPLSMRVSQSEATQRLDTLVDLAVAVVEEDQEGPTYRLRGSLKPFFRTLAYVPPSTLRDVRRMQALFEGGKRPLHSLERLLDVGDLSSAEILAGRHFEDLTDHGLDTLTALRGKSLKELEEFPLLSMLRLVLERAQEEMPVATVEGFARDLQARLLDDRTEHDPTHQAALLATQIAVDRMLGLWDSALVLSRRAMDMFDDPHGRTDEERGELPPALYSAISLTGILSADYGLAQEAAGRGFWLASAQDNRLEKVQALALSALSSALLGNVEEATSYLERLDRLGGHEDLEPYEFGWVNESLARALVAFHKGDPEEGERALERVIPLMHRMEQWPVVAVVEGALARLTRGPHVSYRLLTLRLDQQSKNRETPPAWESQLRTQLATHAVFLGRYDEAQELLDLLATDPDLGEGGMLSLAFAQVRLDLYRGEYQRVLERLETLEYWGSRPRRRTELALLEALARYRLGDPSLVAPALDQLPVGEDLPSILSRFPHELLSEAVEAAGAETLARKLAEVPEHLRSYQHVPLSEAEIRVLQKLAKGLTTVEAADHLYISVNTVKAHRRSIYKKLSAGSWTEAAAAARKRGLLG